jgi:hypothetical protein
MERAQGVSSGPRGPESMVMVCFIASFVKRDTIPIPKATISPKKKERKKEATAGCLSHCKSSMLVLPLGLFTDLWSDQWPRKFVTLDSDNQEPSDTNWTLCLHARVWVYPGITKQSRVSLLFCFLKL